MPLVVNSNVSSVNAQRQLLQSGADLNKASERLASGRRINSAADDAAGLAISNRQTSQIRGLDQAIRNANDGISLIQTAEGALDETTNILQRMRELSIQSSNGIYSDTDRATLDAEAQQLKAEIDRIAETTTFNGQKLLDGSLKDVGLQIGSQANQTISFSVDKMNTEGLGGSANGDVVGTATTSASLLAGLQLVTNGTNGVNDATMTVNGQSVGDLSAATTLQGALDTINSNLSGVEVGAITELVAANDGTGIIRGSDSMNITVVGADGASNTLQIKDTGSMNELVEKINAQAGGLISASLNDEGRLVLSSDSGAQIQVADTAGGDASGVTTTAAVTQNAQLTFSITDSAVEDVDVSYTVAGTTTQTVIANATGVQTRKDGDVTGYAITTFNDLKEGDLVINGVEIGAVTDATGTPTSQGDALVAAINKLSDEHGVVASNSTGTLTLNYVSGKEIKIDFGASAASTIKTDTGLVETNVSVSQGNSIADVDISTAKGAQKAIETIDKALEQINSTRSELGAVNNRLDFTVSNLSNVAEKTEAARSRIVDADFAKETAELSRAQVLQQASQAMLAQANARPQQVLSLLQ